MLQRCAIESTKADAKRAKANVEKKKQESAEREARSAEQDLLKALDEENKNDDKPVAAAKKKKRQKKKKKPEDASAETSPVVPSAGAVPAAAPPPLPPPPFDNTAFLEEEAERSEALAKGKREMDAAVVDAWCAEDAARREAASEAVLESQRAQEEEARWAAGAAAAALERKRAQEKAERLVHDRVAQSTAMHAAGCATALAALAARGLDGDVEQFLSEAFSRRDPTIVAGLLGRATRDSYGRAAESMVQHNLTLVDALSGAVASGRVDVLEATYDAMQASNELEWVSAENRAKVTKAIKRIPKVRLLSLRCHPTPRSLPPPPCSSLRFSSSRSSSRRTCRGPCGASSRTRSGARPWPGSLSRCGKFSTWTSCSTMAGGISRTRTSSTTSG